VSTFWRSSLGRGCSQISSVLSWFLQHNQKDWQDAHVSLAKGYPPGFFESTFGCFRDEPLVIDSESEFEEREALM
jgi:hypothetical protein